MKIIKLQEAQNICDEILKEYKSIGVVCYELYAGGEGRQPARKGL